ncbi:EscU/YscU/HrcU family type III secretion system export apparatus switch protein [Salibacterium qingdaonense]|uniref:Flagellar biosynthesis protein n=1 Tax=Salibacterium qingdaonense TaxID=266892 RepID=A0A1I4JSF5_9BACI|nr:EscU/YscU/HrcU family type III secretion system export apparatus switch protein [Salibacterium qingdaonense]SFL69036.1 flagellar biosynthesis protein [Salibacterium qingdaonense]
MNHTGYFNHVQRKLQNGPSAAVIKYEDGEAPRVTARGSGEAARHILSLAEENDIYLQEDPGLLESLLDMDLGENVPPQLYSVIAEVLILIEEMERKY